MAPATENNDPFDREDAQDDPYNLGMMHGWDASSSEDVSKLKKAWHIPETAPVHVDGCASTGEFNMSYT
eukprot:4083067-Amphidinium_carterae.1